MEMLILKGILLLSTDFKEGKGNAVSSLQLKTNRNEFTVKTAPMPTSNK